MKNTRVIGEKYEKKAISLLKNKGYKLLFHNYYSKRGEIDLIVSKEKILVFVEVKYRKRTDYGNGYEAVDRKKQKKIYLTALDFLQRHNYEDFDMRFDVISFDKNEVSWMKNCFWGDELGF